MYKIYIDQKEFNIEEQFITGDQIKAKVGVPPTYGVWLIVDGPEEDKEIAYNEHVDLAMFGRKRFFTGSKNVTEG
jgi:hypothetical protein